MKEKGKDLRREDVCVVPPGPSPGPDTRSRRETGPERTPRVVRGRESSEVPRRSYSGELLGKTRVMVRR